MESLRLPPGKILKTPASNARRIAAINEAMEWPGTHVAPSATWIYELRGGFSVGAHKPGKEANTSRKWVNAFDMLPLIRQGSSHVGFDSGFGDIFRAMFDVGTLSRHSRQDGAARILGALIYRAAWSLDHKEDPGAPGWRLSLPPDAADIIAEMPVLRIQTPSTAQDLPVVVILHFLEVLALNEDVKYFHRNGGRLKGSAGRTNTLQTCARALACGLGDEHPMTFAYGLSRGNGVASLQRQTALAYFPALG